MMIEGEPHRRDDRSLQPETDTLDSSQLKQISMDQAIELSAIKFNGKEEDPECPL